MTHRVLLVDDDPNVRNGLARALHKEPYQVETAPDPEAALKVFLSRPVDVVIADQHMPGMSGTEFLARVRASHPETIRMILTGQASLEVAIQAINEGQVYRFFTKPANPYDLAITIRQALEQKDLLTKTARLLSTVKKQAALLDRLEEEHPGIARLDEDDEGCLTIPGDFPENREEFLADLQKEIDRAERRLGQRA